ncbi:MAG: efflux RND transporter periplasmic adaptor subunit [Pseudomonadales bacterium]|nr:efflux RND transporter periplasmic adaptor subunit [Pseudomonadales bacterium]MCP5185485.1 efflux RND transporter periplasmic adaptor subunit [Pseudomonadales bacterium]
MILKKLVLPGVVIAMSVLAAAGIMATAPQITPSVPETIPTTVRVMTVAPKPLQLKVRAQGTVLPNTESELISEVPGRVEWIAPAMQSGGYFQAGEVLLRLEDKDARTARERASAALARADAEQQHARYEYERISSLAQQKLISQSQLENTVRMLRVAEAARQEAAASLEQSRRDLARTEIRAPFTGLVRRKGVDVGQFVSRGTPMATLYASDAVEVRLPIADRQLAYLNLPLEHLGDLPESERPKVTLKAEFAGRKLEWEGAIVRTDAQIDLSSRMVYLIARVNNQPGVAPLTVGLFVDAVIEGLTVDNTYSLPRSALRDGNRLLMVDADDTLRYRSVEPFRLFEDQVVLKDGLNAGDRVCISPMLTVVEGTHVNPVESNG